MKKMLLISLAVVFLLTPTIAFAYPPAPIIDGAFTGYTVGDPTHEYSNGTQGPGSFSNTVYFQNDATKLYFMNDWTNDEVNNNSGSSMDYNVFDFDLDRNGYFEWRIIIYADGTKAVLHNGSVIDPGTYATYGIAAAAGFGPSPNKAANHRMYEISINHAGIDNKLYTKPLDPPGPVTPPPKPIITEDPSLDPSVVEEAWPGSVVPLLDGAPTILRDDLPDVVSASTLITLSIGGLVAVILLAAYAIMKRRPKLV